MNENETGIHLLNNLLVIIMKEQQWITWSITSSLISLPVSWAAGILYFGPVISFWFSGIEINKQETVTRICPNVPSSRIIDRKISLNKYLEDKICIFYFGMK